MSERNDQPSVVNTPGPRLPDPAPETALIAIGSAWPKRVYRPGAQMTEDPS